MNSRAYRRVAVNEKVNATILGHPDVTVPCQVLNVSRSGLCIGTDQKIPSGRAVKLEWGRHFLLGRVRRVSAAASGYQVGLELLYCSQWKRPVAAVFVPLWARSVARRCVSAVAPRAAAR